MMPEQKVEQIDLFNYMNDQMSFQAETQSPTKSEQISRLKYFWNNQILRFHVIRKGVVHSLRTYSRTLHIKSCSLIVIRKLSEQAKRGAARIRYGIGVVYDYMKKDRDEFCKGLRCLSMPAEPPEAASDGSRISNLMGLAPWVNVYKVTRAYGGSEHGGWYYRKYTCEKSVQVWRWNAESTAAMYQRTYEKLAWGLICSEAEGLEIAVLIETKKAQLQGEKKPSYHPDIVVKSVLDDAGKRQLQTRSTAGHSSKMKLVKHRPQLESKGALLHFVRAARVDEETCERCKGTGRTPYTHIQNGRCFLCGGSGKMQDQ